MSLISFNGYSIIIWSCLNVFLSFFISLHLWLNVFFGTQGKPRRLTFFHREEADEGHDGLCCQKAP